MAAVSSAEFGMERRCTVTDEVCPPFAGVTAAVRGAINLCTARERHRTDSTVSSTFVDPHSHIKNAARSAALQSVEKLRFPPS